MPQGHLGAIEVEEVHQFNGLALSQSVEVYALRLVVKLELYRIDLDVFCRSAAVKERYAAGTYGRRASQEVV